MNLLHGRGCGHVRGRGRHGRGGRGLHGRGRHGHGGRGLHGRGRGREHRGHGHDHESAHDRVCVGDHVDARVCDRDHDRGHDYGHGHDRDCDCAPFLLLQFKD